MSDYVFEHSQAHRDARHLGTIAMADSGTENSRILFYGTPFGDMGEPPLVEIVLAKPCGAVVDHAIVLQQLDLSGDLIMGSGNATWGLWLAGNGAYMSRGTVTDDEGDGPFKILGADGTLLRGGGRCRLGTSALT